MMDIQKEAIFVTKTPLEEDISTSNPNFAKKIKAARQGMRNYRNALIELAK